MAGLALQDAYIRAGFGEQAFHNTTNVNPVGLVALLAVITAALIVRRRNALVPLLVLSSAVPTGQRVAILTLDFNFIRLLLLAYAARILVKREARGFRVCLQDRLLLGWLVIRLITYTTLHASTNAFIFQAGQLYDFLGLYFTARIYLRDQADVGRAWARLAALSIPIAGLFLLERSTGRNLFSAMGGVPEFTAIRDGRLRCQGPYEHPILAGAYWATLVPLFWGLTRAGTAAKRRLGLLGAACAFAIVIACSSSTPVIGLLAGLGLVAVTRFRKHAGQALGLLAIALVVIHFARERPVWQLIAKAGVVGGSTADYRFRLLDAFIRNWQEWLALGTKGTAHWGYYLFDLTNQYVVEGVRGGILTLILFCSLLGCALTRAWRRSLSHRVAKEERLVSWHSATALGGMSVMFLGISITHSNQTTLVMMLLLAACAARGSRPGDRRPTQDKEPAPTYPAPKHQVIRRVTL